MDDTIRIQRETVEEHIRHENAKNWGGVYDTFVKDASAFIDVVPLNVRFSGLAGVKDFYAVTNAAFPDFKVDVRAEYDAPGSSVCEVTFSGTHTGEWSGVPGTGRRVRFHVASFLLFGSGERRGKILAARVYFDNETVMRQIRGEMESSSVADFPSPELTETRSGD
jgi:predicted ester cyclase